MLPLVEFTTRWLRRLRTPLVLAVVAVLGLTGCSGDDSPETGEESSGPAPTGYEWQLQIVQLRGGGPNDFELSLTGTFDETTGVAMAVYTISDGPGAGETGPVTIVQDGDDVYVTGVDEAAASSIGFPFVEGLEADRWYAYDFLGGDRIDFLALTPQADDIWRGLNPIETLDSEVTNDGVTLTTRRGLVTNGELDVPDGSILEMIGVFESNVTTWSDGDGRLVALEVTSQDTEFGQGARLEVFHDRVVEIPEPVDVIVLDDDDLRPPPAPIEPDGPPPVPPEAGPATTGTRAPTQPPPVEE